MRTVLRPRLPDGRESQPANSRRHARGKPMALEPPGSRAKPRRPCAPMSFLLFFLPSVKKPDFHFFFLLHFLRHFPANRKQQNNSRPSGTTGPPPSNRGPALVPASATPYNTHSFPGERRSGIRKIRAKKHKDKRLPPRGPAPPMAGSLAFE